VLIVTAAGSLSGSAAILSKHTKLTWMQALARSAVYKGDHAGEVADMVLRRAGRSASLL